ncbi:MAG: GSCFA domain-containing protein [Flavobacterium sp. BFFFF1]|uniref:GSCFA domain-containing protein n=1 Tax=Flavobacterium sp. BFFFF1 TaxID=2015557 RepID=UPI000BCB689D|nr:GSCFA domain-containing protein [Flavobacterium sp. BFFFF1]OYU81663.1 MAG: GSCFA domain-containing protein [Flavobacterium sp. BFFFF1]
MQFTTQITIPESSHKIGYHSAVVSLGSCFAENMADQFGYYKFSNTVNPFGIIFQPLALAKIISFAVTGKQFTASDVFMHHDVWHCFDAHSALSNSNKAQLLDNLNDAAQQLRQALSGASHLIVTLGTSWIYRHSDTNEAVANCHKLPAKSFRKELLSVDAIAESLQEIIAGARFLNPDCHIILTVSPVRHIKDGFPENQWSKSHLIAAVHTVLNGLTDKESASYFPSYEIMMDELRDYRFYAEDMLHPSQTAVDYIWERFKTAYVDQKAYAVMDKVDRIQKGLAHRPFNPETAQHQAFVAQLQNEITQLKSEFPHIRF